jgi:hypothetical protein
MGRPRTLPSRIAALALLSLAAFAAAAYAATSVSYSGQTSQGRAISFRLTTSAVTGLRYRIDDHCPGGKLLFVTNFGFPALTVKHTKFGGTFVAQAPQKATAIVRGTVTGQTVTGTLSDRTMNNKTHKFCSGKATFRLAPPSHKRRARGQAGPRSD